MRILIAEDHPDNREMLTRRLQRRGYEVHVAENGETAPSAAAVLDTIRTNNLVDELADGCLRQVYQNTVTGGILQEASGQQADMLVVIARRHSLLGGLFHRSVTAQLLRESAIPVLVLPAAE